MKQAIKRIGDILFYGLMLLMIFVLVQRIRDPQSMPKLFGFTPTVVVSESMLPTLQVYSYNIIRDCDIDRIAEGDIIVYRNEARGMNIIHRVYEIVEVDGERRLHTWGDNNRGPDAMETTADNLLGKVVLTMNWPARVIQTVKGEDYRMSQQTAPIVVGLMVMVAVMLLLGALLLLFRLALRLMGVTPPKEEAEEEERAESARETPPEKNDDEKEELP